MDFTRLKLTEGISSSNNLATNAEAKTSELASGIGRQKQMDPSRKEQQIKQRAARMGPTTMNNTVDVSPTGSTNESYLNTLHRVEVEKARRHHTHDWRQELAEAVNPDDDPQHPYVEIMPHHKYKEKEAKKNAAKAAMTDRQNGEPPLRTGVNEEVLDEAKKSERKRGSTVKPKKVSSKTKKAAKELGAIDKKARAEAKKARRSYKKALSYHKKGQYDKATKENHSGHKHASSAKKLRAQGMKYVPIGSPTYTKSTNPTEASGKFKRDLRSPKGRESIALRTIGEGFDDDVRKFADKILDDLKPKRKSEGKKSFVKNKDNRFTFGNPIKEDDAFDVFANFLDENRWGGDPQKLGDKKSSGKAVPMSRGVRNADNTATPKENVLRRKVNANPDMRGKAGKHAVDRMMKEQSMADAKKRRQNLTIEVGMRKRQANPEMPKPNLEMAKEGLEQDFTKEKQRRHDIGMELAQREKADKDRIAKRRERVNYKDYRKSDAKSDN